VLPGGADEKNHHIIGVGRLTRDGNRNGNPELLAGAYMGQNTGFFNC